MPITALPTPPSRADSSTFAARGDAFLGALPTFATEANALQADVNTRQVSTGISATNAANSAAAAAASASAAGTSASAAQYSAANAAGFASGAGSSAASATSQATNAANSGTAAASSATLAATSATAANTSATNAAASAASVDPAALRRMAQNSQSANYTVALTDAGKHLFHPASDVSPRTWTIPANASVAFPIGSVVTFVNQNAAGTITIAISSDTMRLAGNGLASNRSLGSNGIATALKIGPTEWLIDGTGLS